MPSAYRNPITAALFAAFSVLFYSDAFAGKGNEIGPRSERYFSAGETIDSTGIVDLGGHTESGANPALIDHAQEKAVPETIKDQPLAALEQADSTHDDPNDPSNRFSGKTNRQRLIRLRGLIQALKDNAHSNPPPEVELAVLSGEFDFPEYAIKALAESANDEHWPSAGYALRALDKQPAIPPSARPALVKALGDERQDFRFRAADLLLAQDPSDPDARRAVDEHIRSRPSPYTLDDLRHQTEDFAITFSGYRTVQDVLAFAFHDLSPKIQGAAKSGLLRYLDWIENYTSNPRRAIKMFGGVTWEEAASNKFWAEKARKLGDPRIQRTMDFKFKDRALGAIGEIIPSMLDEINEESLKTTGNPSNLAGILVVGSFGANGHPTGGSDMDIIHLVSSDQSDYPRIGAGLKQRLHERGIDLEIEEKQTTLRWNSLAVKRLIHLGGILFGRSRK